MESDFVILHRTHKLKDECIGWNVRFSVSSGAL